MVSTFVLKSYLIFEIFEVCVDLFLASGVS